jgi:hypothetical protein
MKGPGPNNSYKPITNTAWIRARLCKLQKRCTRLTSASDKVYQLLAHGRWFYPGSPASSTTKTGRYDIAEILLKVALNTKTQLKLNSIITFSFFCTVNITRIICYSGFRERVLLSIPSTFVISIWFYILFFLINCYFLSFETILLSV